MRDLLDDRPIKLRSERSTTPASIRPFLVGLGLCVLAAVLIVLDRSGQLGQAHAAADWVVAPVAQRLTGLRDELLAQAQAPRGEEALAARIAELERENSQLRADLLRSEEAVSENVFLRQQLEIEQAQPWELVGAEVVLRSPDAARRVITIARGSNDGLAPGMAVIGQDPGGPTALVGLIETVGPRSAEVLLITDVVSQISARVLQDQASALGLVFGRWQLGSRLRIEQVDRVLRLREGDTVVTAGLTAALDLPLDLAAVPPNIPIGSIDQIDTSGQRQAAELRPFVDPDQVRYVWVIVSHDD